MCCCDDILADSEGKCCSCVLESIMFKWRSNLCMTLVVVSA